MTAFRLEAFRTQREAPRLVPCTQERAWMDVFTDRHAYRCLPLSIANTHGWELLVPGAFEVEWNGGHHEHGVTKVLFGERLTMAAFYTVDESHREREIYGLGPLGE